MITEKDFAFDACKLIEKVAVSQEVFDFVVSRCACYDDGVREYYYVGNRWLLLEVKQ